MSHNNRETNPQKPTQNQQMLESVDKDINEIIKTVSYVRKLCRYMKDIKKESNRTPGLKNYYV